MLHITSDLYSLACAPFAEAAFESDFHENCPPFVKLLCLALDLWPNVAKRATTL